MVFERDLPSAGSRAKAIDSPWQFFRDYLNENASHSSLKKASIRHLFNSKTFAFKKRQEPYLSVLAAKHLHLAVQVKVLIYEAMRSLESVTSPERFNELGERLEALKQRLIDVFGLDALRRAEREG